MSSASTGPRSQGWLWTLVVAGFFSQTALNLVRPVTTYKLIDLGADATAVGLVTAAYAILPVVSAMWLGRLTDRIPGLRVMVGIGALVLAAGAAALALAGTIVWVAAASAVLGMGHLIFTIAGQSAIARFSPNDQLDRGFGWFTAAYAGGQIAGPLVAGLLLGDGAGIGPGTRAEGTTFSMWLGAALALTVLPVLLPGIIASRGGTRGRGTAPGERRRRAVLSAPAPQDDGGPGRPTMGAILNRPGVRSNMLASLALLAMLDILTAFLPLVGEAHGVSPAWIGMLLAARGAGTIISRGFLPYLSRRIARRILLMGSLYGAGICLAVPALVIDTPWATLVLLFAGGIFLGLGQPLTMSLISESVPHSWRGSALAVRLMGNRLGQVVMPLAAGLIAAPLGPAGAIWFGCAVLVGSGVQKSLGPAR
ncbi:MFS transporter [Arthrobacter sp. JSM 101049]|uniref:MFS transporter n=1 Tax=Arthrobacter sp. JSM 101049 TaxID=929097 RepID=UPI00356794BC